MSGKSFSIRESNISVFNDTVDRIKTTAYLKEAVEKATENQQIILENTEIPKAEDKYQGPSKIYVTKSSSFDAAREYISNKVCVLNFASATTPGGGVTKGSSAQEECLCRCSTLYNSLNIKECFDKFYTPHRESLGPLHNDDIIYTPGVVIFKEDNYHILQNDDWTKVDVLTCAAPNLRPNPKNAYNEELAVEKVEISDEDLYNLHVKRARRIFNVAANNGCDTLIVGAFGCGAFKNDPVIVAKAYKAVLSEFKHCFRNIEFAVYCRPDDDTNYRVFKKVILGE